MAAKEKSFQDFDAPIIDAMPGLTEAEREAVERFHHARERREARERAASESE